VTPQARTYRRTTAGVARQPSRVLIVDDDPSIREFLALVLEDSGYEVRVASNGQDALEVLGHWRPAVILLDLMMPLMDGYTFRSEQLRRNDFRDIPVIVLSARTDSSAAARTLQPAARLTKPCDLDQLLQIVEQVAGPDASSPSSL
jgi:CheY-like chemotaxis protein